MLIEIDVIAIILMESFGAIFFLLAFIFIKHSQTLGSKMKILQETLVKAAKKGEREEKPCYSYKWIMSHIMKPKKSISPSSFHPLFVMALTGVIVAILLTIFQSAGYSLLITLIGAAVLETDAFEAYSYSKTIQKVTLDQLNKEDHSYMEIAREALKIGATRFLVAGVICAVAGPFIPLIFDSLIYALALYLGIVFHVTKTTQNISKGLAVFIAIILSATLLYLPQLAGRTVLIKIKAAIRKRRRHKENRV